MQTYGVVIIIIPGSRAGFTTDALGRNPNFVGQVLGN
jgi:hypothetical protein